MKQRLACIQSRWRRFLIKTVLTILSWLNCFTYPRARVHWIGHHRRIRRLERPLMALLFVSAWLLLEPREYVLWSIALGPAMSLGLILLTARQLLPRKRYRWIKRSRE